MTTIQLSRRSIIQGGAVLGSLLVGFRLFEPNAEAAEGPRSADLNAFVRVASDGSVTMTIPSVEMGQGAYTSMAMLLAEELDIGLARVKVEHAPADRARYANPIFKEQMTGGSTSMMAWYLPLRKAGAKARALLVDAAAEKWGVEPGTLSTSDGRVVHSATSRSAEYGELVALVRSDRAVSDLPLKDRSSFNLIGKPLKRLDTPAKVDGSAVYGIDVLLPDMKFATMTSSPVLGGKVLKVDDSRTKLVSGVHRIVVLDDLVAVIASNTWSAMRGLEELRVDWSESDFAGTSQNELWVQIAAASEGAGAVAKREGDAPAKLKGEGVFEATFELPFQAHAALEPANCTVHFHDDRCDILVGTQVMVKAQLAAAKAADIDPAKVTVRNHLIGGGFGRRLDVDDVVKAVRIAKEVDGPLKVVWSREEDIRQDFFRPMYHLHTRAKVEQGKIVAWHHRITGSSILSRWVPMVLKDGVDADAIEGAVEMPYDFSDTLIEYIRHETPNVTTSFWRGVGPNANVFAAECLIDRIAHEIKVDPIELRRRIIASKPRARAVLDLAADKFGWLTPPAARPGARVGRGVALLSAFGSFLATIAEVAVADDGDVRVLRVVNAVDVGAIVNPNTVEAQMQGGTVFGIGAVLHGHITIKNGRVEQSNFHDYRVARIDDTPIIECHLVKNDEPPGGIGEPGTVTVQAAIANAVSAATGKKLTRMPIDKAMVAARS